MSVLMAEARPWSETGRASRSHSLPSSNSSRNSPSSSWRPATAAGYIERNFTLYTSTFHGERISANATNFMMKNIEPNVTDMFFTLTRDDVDAIIREKGQAVLRERSAYNISVLDQLLGAAPGAADILTGQSR